MTNETIATFQIQVDEFEKQKDAKTPPEARLAQHDKNLLDLNWELDDSKVHIQNADEHEAYWKAQGTAIRVWGLLVAGILFIKVLPEGVCMNRWEYTKVIKNIQRGANDFFFFVLILALLVGPRLVSFGWEPQ